MDNDNKDYKTDVDSSEYYNKILLDKMNGIFSEI